MFVSSYNATNYTARRTIFSRSWNILESSKRPSKYHLSINFLVQKKTVFPSPKSSKQELFKAQNKNFSVTSKYNLSINFLAHKRPYFPTLKSSKQELFSNQYTGPINSKERSFYLLPALKKISLCSQESIISISNFSFRANMFLW